MISGTLARDSLALWFVANGRHVRSLSLEVCGPMVPMDGCLHALCATAPLSSLTLKLFAYNLPNLVTCLMLVRSTLQKLAVFCVSVGDSLDLRHLRHLKGLDLLLDCFAEPFSCCLPPALTHLKMFQPGDEGSISLPKEASWDSLPTHVA